MIDFSLVSFHEPRPAVGRRGRVLVAVGMSSLSLTGLLGRLTPTSVAACLFLALASGAFYCGGCRACRIRLAFWMALPLLVPSALAALLPPYTWDEVAYGAALPRDFARAGRFFYSPDYGVHMAFPGNYPFMNAALGAHNDFTPTHSALLRESIEGLGDFSFKSGLAKTFAAQVAKGFGLLPAILVLPGAWLALRPRRSGEPVYWWRAPPFRTRG